MKAKRHIALVLILLVVTACGSTMTPAAITATPRRPVPSPTTGIANSVPMPTQPELSPAQAEHWQHYPSYNDVQDLAFAPDGTLWAAVTGGVVQWDITSDMPLYHSLSNDVYSHVAHQIAITSDYGVWVATNSGIFCLDGDSDKNSAVWRTYTTEDGLPADAAYAIVVGANGMVWAGTEKGLVAFDGMQWTTYGPPNVSSTARIWYIAVADAGTVWASTHREGLWRYVPANDTWSIYRDEFPFPNARALGIADDGTPWMYVGYDNVYRLNNTMWEMAYEATGGRWVCDMAFPSTTRPYIATCSGYHSAGTGLAYFEGDAWDYITVDDGLLHNSLSSVALSHEGTLAVGTDRGISVQQNGVWRALRYGPTLRDITASAVTPDGMVWFGFGNSDSRPPGGGVARFDGRHWQYFDDGTLALPANVRTLAISPAGEVWAGGSGQIAHFQVERWHPFASYAAGDLWGNVHTLAFAPNGDLWAATDFDLYQFLGGAATDAPTAHKAKIPTALAIPADDTVWINRAALTHSGGAQTFDGATWLTPTTPVTYVNLFVAPNGDLWATGAQSVGHLAGTTWTHHAVGLPADLGVSALAFTPDDTLWAITHDQLLFWDSKRWRAIGLPFSVALHTLSASPDGSLWLGTDYGALHYRP